MNRQTLSKIRIALAQAEMRLNDSLRLDQTVKDRTKNVTEAISAINQAQNEIHSWVKRKLSDKILGPSQTSGDRCSFSAIRIGDKFCVDGSGALFTKKSERTAKSANGPDTIWFKSGLIVTAC